MDDLFGSRHHPREIQRLVFVAIRAECRRCFAQMLRPRLFDAAAEAVRAIRLTRFVATTPDFGGAKEQ